MYPQKLQIAHNYWCILDICIIFFKNEFLLCKPFETTTKSCDIFEKVHLFIEIKKSSENICGVWTDDAPSWLRCRSGFKSLVHHESVKTIETDYMIHRQILGTKALPQELQNVMIHVINSANFFKAKPLNRRLFSKICNESNSSENVLLFHREL
ncbi:Protein ZBED8 [Thelohanellus kitauei]|uniref:Protein ZBED8 n=1 Tax=Thelohanellus kitauei TaxID=669202 RepID=A0A0C2JFK8_THEKT|nr:Protein ZBED8 [Thelohanellus kitauei]